MDMIFLRKTGVTVLISLLVSFLVILIFQYLALQDLTLQAHPEMDRSITIGSYPNSYAGAVFALAAVVWLVYRQRRWLLLAVSGALLISLIPLYLGLAYPADIFGGAILGLAVGAACYGIFWPPRPNWRWLLWPQLAIVIIVSQMAYLNILPFQLLRWPLADKVLHFLLFGAVVFWLNLWLKGRKLRLGPYSIPVAILLLLIPTMIEEGFQSFSTLRTTDITDLTSDISGMFFFWWLSNKFIVSEEEQI
jgi:hypothetical protein